MIYEFDVRYDIVYFNYILYEINDVQLMICDFTKNTKLLKNYEFLQFFGIFWHFFGFCKNLNC